MVKMMRYFFLFFGIALLISGCDNSGIGKYNALVANELKTGRRVNSIFFGIYLGMTSKAFFTHCWELNKQGVFTDGTNNMYVLHKLNKGELKYPAAMNFYPDFFEGKIADMRVLFQYDGWAPWNKQYFSDKLLPDVLQFYKRLYPDGNPFIKIENDKKGTIYVKVDGNRSITIGRHDDMVVKVAITDLITERKMLNSNGAKK
jgi:hypothetical protein